MKKLTTELFVEKANLVHNNKYVYDKTIYLGALEPLLILCPIHGYFYQAAHSHLQGKGCKKCGDLTSSIKNKSNTTEWIKKANLVHNNKYIYDKSVYVHSEESLIITCPIHGDFEQTACNHLKGNGCPKCSINKNAANQTLTLQQVIDKSNFVHYYKYVYDRTIYESSSKKMIITCPIHGDFEQVANAHMNGHGCLQCSIDKNISIGEKEIGEFISSLGIDFISSDRTILKYGKELDIYIPEKKIAFEYNGLYFHSEAEKSNKNYHLQKTEECLKQGIRLIHIFEDEWLDKQAIVKSRIANLLGVSKYHTYARKCIIKEVSKNEAKLFLERHHIQGFCNSSVQIGLYQKDKLLALMTFGPKRINLGSKSEFGSYELLRFCNFQNLNVVGGASKLLKYFIKHYTPKEIISYCDRRWSDGNLYEKLGFTFSHNSIPNYFYIINRKRENRFKYRKDILVSKYGCHKDMTEKEFCFSKRWYRIYDCGTKVYKLITNKLWLY